MHSTSQTHIGSGNLTYTRSRLTNATPAREYLATINGVAASLGCLARTLGPMVLGPLFKLGIKVGFAGLPFSAMSLVAGAALLVAVFLRNHP